MIHVTFIYLYILLGIYIFWNVFKYKSTLYENSFYKELSAWSFQYAIGILEPIFYISWEQLHIPGEVNWYILVLNTENRVKPALNYQIRGKRLTVPLQKDRGRNTVCQGRTHQLALQYQMASLENIPTSNIIQSEQVAFMHLEIYMSIQKLLKNRGHEFESKKVSMRKFGGKKGNGEMV